MLSLLEREVNFQQNPYNTSQHNFSMQINMDGWMDVAALPYES